MPIIMEEPIHIQVFSCSKCDYQTQHFPQLLNHYNGIHEFERNFSIVCGIENCQNFFRKVRSFQFHILRKHPTFHHQYLHGRNRQAERNVIIEENEPRAGAVEDPAVGDFEFEHDE